MDMEKFQMWHAQGIWVQVLIMVMFSWSFFEKPKYQQRRNIPLGLLHLWVGINTAFVCTLSQIKGVYNYWTLFPYFNFLCLVILYTLITRYITREQTKTVLVYMRYVVIATLGMCVLQYIGLSQFFKLFVRNTGPLYYNIVTGFIGNGTHLSGFLAMCTPLFLIKKSRENYLALSLLFFILCFSGTTVNDPSISGFIIAGFLVFYMSEKKFFTFGMLIVFVGLLGIFLSINNSKFFVPSGRLPLWEAYIPLLKGRFITGSGLGTVKLLSATPQFPDAHHLHLEYYQYLVELGFIGLMLILNIIVSFIKLKPANRTDRALKGIVYGFLISCFFNFPSHLWLPSTWCIVCYSLFLIQERENGIFPQGDQVVSTKFDQTERNTNWCFGQ